MNILKELNTIEIIEKDNYIQLSKQELLDLKEGDKFYDEVNVLGKNTFKEHIVDSIKITSNGNKKVRYTWSYARKIRYSNFTINDNVNQKGEFKIYSDSEPGRCSTRVYYKKVS